MQQITTLTNEPKQRHQLILDTNERVDFLLYYCARVQAWFFDWKYKEIEVKCSKVVLSPNTLRNFKKNIPFGIAFATQGNVEPFAIDDFSSGRVQMYVLNAAEVEEIEREIFNS